MDEHEVEHLFAQAAQARLHTIANGTGREVIFRDAALEELAHFCGEDEFPPPMGDRLSDAFLTRAIGGCGVDVVDAKIEHAVQ